MARDTRYEWNLIIDRFSRTDIMITHLPALQRTLQGKSARSIVRQNSIGMESKTHADISTINGANPVNGEERRGTASMSRGHQTGPGTGIAVI